MKGTIEDIPLPDASVGVVISNCVINLSVDKPRVLSEMFRVLKPGGRIGISDVVAEDHLTPVERAARGSYVGCIAGALSRTEYLDGLTAAGFVDVTVRFTHQAADGMHSDHSSHQAQHIFSYSDDERAGGRGNRVDGRRLCPPVTAGPALRHRAVAEMIGTAFLVAAVVGSGIAAQRLSPGDVGLQLLENAIATGAALAALIVAHCSPPRPFRTSCRSWYLGSPANN